jgi:hypothetical protein
MYHFDVLLNIMSGIIIIFLNSRIKSKLPVSAAFECVEAAHAFCLDASSLHFITEHFRYKFPNE